MRSYIHWADDASEVEAEIQSQPRPAKKPLSDERFNKLIMLGSVACITAGTVAVTIVLGFPGLLFAGMIDAFIALFSAIDKDSDLF